MKRLSMLGLLSLLTSLPAFAETDAQKAELEIFQKQAEFNLNYVEGKTDYVYRYTGPGAMDSTTQADTSVAGLVSAARDYQSCVTQCLKANPNNSICGARCAEQFPKATPGAECYKMPEGTIGLGAVSQNCGRTVPAEPMKTTATIEMPERGAALQPERPYGVGTPLLR